MINKKLRAPLLLTSTLILLLTTTAACNSSSGYEIPKTLCGREIDRSALQPLLPSGKNVEARPQISDDGRMSFLVLVSKSRTVPITVARAQYIFGVMELA